MTGNEQRTTAPNRFDQSEQKNTSSAMRAFLLCPDGTYRAIWLPQNTEGRYKFLDELETDNLPFYIEAVQDKWVMYCTDGAVFYSVGYGKKVNTGAYMPLRDKMFHFLEYKEETYTLYAEFEQRGDNIFLPYYFEPRQEDYTIGRDDEYERNLIAYNNRAVSRRHAQLHWNGAQWEIMDRGSTNGVYVNGHLVQRQVLSLGDVVFIMGLYLVVGVGYIAMNNVNGRVSIHTPFVRMIEKPDKNYIVFSNTPKMIEKDALFDRPPRKLTVVNPDPIEIEMPPMKMGGNKIPLMLRLGNPLLMGGQALMMGNYLSMVSSMVLPAVTQGLTEKDRKEYEARRAEKYGEYLQDKEAELKKEKETEKILLEQANPSLRRMMDFAKSKERLWERRKNDSDFLTVRIGTGDIPLIAERQYSRKKFELEEDELTDQMYTLAEKSFTIEQAPITLSLMEDYMIGLQGLDEQIIDWVRNVILQLATSHSYDELKIAVLADGVFADQLNFVRYLPHNWDDERSIRFFATSKPDAQVMARYFKNIEEGVFQAQEASKKVLKSDRPVFVVFALNKNLYEAVEIFKSVLEAEDYRGISLVTAFEGLPKECSKIIELKGSMQIVDLKDPEKDEISFILDSYNEPRVKEGLQALYSTKLKINSEMYTLPNMITFLEMFKAGKVEFLNPLSRWKENNPVKSLAAPIGVGTDGSIFTLDLHEKRQGPHGLIAGMTGSGKSEFIITYILSMAVMFSPEEVAFILIDYKGGGLADAFENPSRGIHLPHIVGTITNLDGAAIQRSLMSINSELKRRQNVFKKAKSDNNEGTMDIYDYQKLYRAKKVKEPMPHLFIISDEFAELKKQQPEFMDELISTARIGRSLGVHLILATQKPGGVVNDQIWSNTKFRVCLKVQDRGDSMEMLKRPEAAELKQTGRFYLQVGYNEYFALGQSAWCGAGYVPDDNVVKEEDVSVEFLDNAGQVVLKAKPKKEVKKAVSKQIVAIVQYLSDLAKREKIQAKPLWMEPLPKKLDFASISAPRSNKEGHIQTLVGMVDDPEFQTQYPLVLDLQSFHHMLLCGSSGSGKSTMLRTMLYSLVKSYSPSDINYYILDLSAGALNAFKNTPHCGAYLTEENEADFDRLLKLIKDIVAERKALFAEADVFGFDAYRKVARLPLILFILDGWTNINTFQRGQEYSIKIHENMREAANYGIRFIFTVNNNNEISAKARQELDFRIVLRAKDKFDYNDILGVRNATVPPEGAGRGICLMDGRPLEYQVAVPNIEEDDQKQNALMKAELEAVSARDRREKPAARLPMMDGSLRYVDFSREFAAGRIPLGYTMESMEKTAIPLQQLYTTGLFFGNSLGVRPVMQNLLEAFYRENADVIVMRRTEDTIFDQKMVQMLQSAFGERFTLLESTPEEMARLDELVIGNIQQTKMSFRNEYCEMNGIPATDKGRTKKATRYIREHSSPLIVLFESFADILRMQLEQDVKAEFEALFEQIKGYNVYFFGGFYPEDENLSSKSLLNSFMKEDFALLFGGKFHTAWLTKLPSMFRNMEKVDPNYNRFVMKYHGECYRMIMPCGELITGTEDPDEADIV